MVDEHSFLRDRFEELRSELRELREELTRTRHGLKGSVDTMVVVQAEHVIEIRNLAAHNDRLEEMMHMNSKEHEARLRVLEDIAASMRDVPQRLGVVEHELAQHRMSVAKIPELCNQVEGQEERIANLRSDVNVSGRFTWKDVYAALAAVAALTGIISIIIGNA